MRTPTCRALAAAAVALATLVTGVLPCRAADHPDAVVKAFVVNYCLECHGPKKQKGDRRFDQLTFPIDKVDGLTDLQDMLDQLNLGEMPPKKAKQPSQREAHEAIARLTTMVTEARAKFASTGARSVLRRLNRREYLNTVGDLFAMNMSMFDPTRKFPRDQTVEHMDNIGDTLKTSGYLLEQYLEAADRIVDKAFALTERPAEQHWKFDGNFQQQPELRYSHGKVFDYRYLCVYESGGSVSEEGAYGPINGFQKGVPVDGFYEIRAKAEAKNRKNPYDPKIFAMDPAEPFRLGIVPGNVQAGPLHHSQPTQPLLAEATVPDDEPQWITFKVWLDAGFTPRFTFPNGMVDCRKTFQVLNNRYKNLLPEGVRNNGGIVEARYNVLKYGHMPHIRIHEVQIRGPLYESWPSPTQKAVLGDKPFEAGRTREIIERFAGRAYRRPARADEVDRLMAVVDGRRKAGATPMEAMKDGLKAVLCSPAFLYLSDPNAHKEAGDTRLSAHELGARLSYFLWSTIPDDELRKAADSGELLKPAVLAAQVRRMLASPRSESFVQGFLDSWLNLRSLGDMPPDRNDFPHYYSHDLQNAMRRETQLFTAHLIETNEPITRFIDADYTFLNGALARLYGMHNAVAPEKARTFQKVKLENPNRGGLLGHASVLTVSANGVETSPVTRGVWLLENILGTPPAPPPDNVPPIDPDVRGAKTMRDILTKHRNNPTCFECHRKIDPLGFALESFDPIGSWRDTYHGGTPVDTSGQLPDGSSFKDVGGLKKVLLDRKDQFARMLTERLLTYACGRRVEALDRPVTNHVVDETRKQGYGFRTLIEQVVLSDAFRSR